MVYLFYTKVEKEALLESFDFYLEKLPLVYQSSILVCKNLNTKVIRLASRLLLDQALKLSGEPTGFNDIDFTPSGRPFINGEIDFSISHSGEYAVCAISKGKRVGVDIEKIRKVDTNVFCRYFTPEQMTRIKQSKNPREDFFKNWTYLESLLKAEGDGFSRGVPDIKSEKADSFLLKGTTWYSREVKVAAGYFCSITVDLPETGVSIQHIGLDRF